MNASLPHSSHLPLTAPSATIADFKIAAALGLAGAIGTAMTMPYCNAVLPGMGLGPAATATVSATQGALLFGLAWAGLRIGRTLRLDAPALRARVTGKTSTEVSPLRGLWRSALLGLALGALVGALALVLPMPELASPPHPTRLQGLLASCGGPFIEEVMCRLFAMSAATWLVSKLTRSRRGSVYTAGNVIAAAAFAALHVPQATAIFGTMTPSLWAIILAGNGLVGLACGQLFKTKGLEHAIAAHFGADIALHVLFAC